MTFFKELLEEIDEDGSGEIEFGEFCQVYFLKNNLLLNPYKGYLECTLVQWRLSIYPCGHR